MSAEAPGDGAAASGRRQARRSAIVLLYQRDVLDHEMPDLVDRYERDAGARLPDYAGELVDGVLGAQPGLDETISRLAEGWTLDRVAPLERNVLRVALYEIEAGSVPPAAAIAEAVAYAKRYASPEAASFVNGILAARARELGLPQTKKRSTSS